MSVISIVILSQPVAILILACVVAWQEIRLREIRQHIQNINVEVFYPMAQVVQKDGKTTKRVTLHGAVATLMNIAKAQNTPKVGKKIIINPAGGGKVIFTPQGAIQVQAPAGQEAEVKDHPGTQKPKFEEAK